METEITRTFRYLAPSDYSMKVEGFSLVSEIEKYESGVFEAGGYNWKLLFYPTGDKKNNGGNHISLYLAIVMTDSLPLPWDLNINFKFFVHNQLEDKYLIIQDHANGGVKRFNAMKTTWGFAQLLSLKTFKESSNGYIVDDSCLFGVEVFVMKHTGEGESLSLVKAPKISNPTFTWEIKNFSELKQDYINSAVFTVAERNWMLKIYPKGHTGYAGKSLGLYLIASDWESQIPMKAGVHAEYKLRVVDQVNGKHAEYQASRCFSTSGKTGYGSPSIVSLADLRKPSNGFIVKDSLTLEVEFIALSHSKYSRKKQKIPSL